MPFTCTAGQAVHDKIHVMFRVDLSGRAFRRPAVFPISQLSVYSHFELALSAHTTFSFSLGARIGREDERAFLSLRCKYLDALFPGGHCSALPRPFVKVQWLALCVVLIIVGGAQSSLLLAPWNACSICRSVNQPIERPIEGLIDARAIRRAAHSTTEWSFDRRLERPSRQIGRPIGACVHRSPPTDAPIDRQTYGLMDRHTHRPITRPIDRSTDPPVEGSIARSFERLTDRPTNRSEHAATEQPLARSIGA